MKLKKTAGPNAGGSGGSATAGSGGAGANKPVQLLCPDSSTYTKMMEETYMEQYFQQIKPFSFGATFRPLSRPTVLAIMKAHAAFKQAGESAGLALTAKFEAAATERLKAVPTANELAADQAAIAANASAASKSSAAATASAAAAAAVDSKTDTKSSPATAAAAGTAVVSDSEWELLYSLARTIDRAQRLEKWTYIFVRLSSRSPKGRYSALSDLSFLLLSCAQFVGLYCVWCADRMQTLR